MATRWTTPTIKATVHNIDVSDCTVMMTLWQYTNRMRSRSKTLDIEDSSLAKSLVGDDTVIVATLTQEQSGMFDAYHDVSVIVNFIDSNGTRGATDPYVLRLKDNPVSRELENGTGTIVPHVDYEVDLVVAEMLSTVTVGNGAITTEKLHDGAVTTPKISDSQVTTAKIASSAVTEAKIADGAVTASKVGTGVMTDARTTVLSLAEIDALFTAQ